MIGSKSDQSFFGTVLNLISLSASPGLIRTKRILISFGLVIIKKFKVCSICKLGQCYRLGDIIIIGNQTRIRSMIRTLFPVGTTELEGALVWLPLDIHICRETKCVIPFSLNHKSSTRTTVSIYEKRHTELKHPNHQWILGSHLPPSWSPWILADHRG